MSQAALGEAAGVTQAAIQRLEAIRPGAGRPDTLDAPRWTLEGPPPSTASEKMRRAISRQGERGSGRILRAANPKRR